MWEEDWPNLKMDMLSKNGGYAWMAFPKTFPYPFLLPKHNKTHSHFPMHFPPNTSLSEYTHSQYLLSKYPKHIQTFPKYSTWFPEIILNNLV